MAGKRISTFKNCGRRKVSPPAERKLNVSFLHGGENVKKNDDTLIIAFVIIGGVALILAMASFATSFVIYPHLAQSSRFRGWTEWTPEEIFLRQVQSEALILMGTISICVFAICALLLAVNWLLTRTITQNSSSTLFS